MRQYDPSKTPNPRDWLALDELERIQIVEQYHEEQGDYGESLQMHAAIHAVVEAQLAEKVRPVKSVFQRLRKEGLNRHDTIHAIGSILAEYIWKALDEEQVGDLDEGYFDELSELTKESWESTYEGDA